MSDPIRKRYRITVDVTVEVHTIETDAAAVETQLQRWIEPDLGRIREHLEQQSRLQQAVLQEPETFEILVQREAWSVGTDQPARQVSPPAAHLDDRYREEDLIASALARLPDSDRQYFEEAIQERAWTDSAGTFYDSFVGKIEGVSFEVLPDRE